MTITTIKVSSEVRDALKAQARTQGRTLNQHLEALLAEENRKLRFERLQEQMRLSPPDQDYVAEAEDWTSNRWN